MLQVLEAPATADVGDTLRVWLLVTDNDGVASSSATVTGTVTEPDVSTTAMTVTEQAATGLYLLSYDTTAAGRHQVQVGASSATFGDDVEVFTVEVAAATGTVPTLTLVKAYLGTTSFSDSEITDAMNAEAAAQLARCRIPPSYPADLAQALKRRVQCNLARRQLPLGMLPGDGAGAQASTVPGNDAEVRRLESPYRRVTVG